MQVGVDPAGEGGEAWIATLLRRSERSVGAGVVNRWRRKSTYDFLDLNDSALARDRSLRRDLRGTATTTSAGYLPSRHQSIHIPLLTHACPPSSRAPSSPSICAPPSRAASRRCPSWRASWRRASHAPRQREPASRHRGPPPRRLGRRLHRPPSLRQQCGHGRCGRGGSVGP